MTRAEYAARSRRARAARDARLTRQDARISVCPGCDDWRWDSSCRRCDMNDNDIRRAA